MFLYENAMHGIVLWKNIVFLAEGIYNIILKGIERVFFNKQLHFETPWYSLRTVQHAFMQISFKKCNIFVHSFEHTVVFLAQKKTHKQNHHL